ncbi:MAG: hypothetical protein MUD12_15120 [Spirochaetes bacterium]|jgi:hypothetical protein|nr:hypothetical protein [Spirochaetota bacterium]
MKKVMTSIIAICVVMLAASVYSEDYNPFDDKGMKEVGRITHESNIVSRALLKVSDWTSTKKDVPEEQRKLIDTEKKVFKDSGPFTYPNVKVDTTTLSERAWKNSPQGKELDAMVDRFMGATKEEKKFDDAKYNREMQGKLASKDPKVLEEVKNNPFAPKDLRDKAGEKLAAAEKETEVKQNQCPECPQDTVCIDLPRVHVDRETVRSMAKEPVTRDYIITRPKYKNLPLYVVDAVLSRGPDKVIEGDTMSEIGVPGMLRIRRIWCIKRK